MFYVRKLQVLCFLCWCQFFITSLVLAEPKKSVDGWEIKGLKVNTTANAVQLLADSVYWADELQFNQVKYQCPQQVPVFPQHECQQASVALDFQGQSYQAKLDSYIDFQSNQWSLALSDPTDAVQLKITDASQWVDIVLHNIELHELLALTKSFQGEVKFPTAQIDGALAFDWQKLQLYSQEKLTFSGLNYEYSDDIIVADLSGSLSFSLDAMQPHLRYTLSVTAGEMLFDQLYVDFSSYPVDLQGEVTALSDGWFNVSSELRNHQSLLLNAQVQVHESLQWRSPQITAEVIDSHHFNQQILNSVLGIYGFGGSEMSGQFTVTADSIAADLDQWQIKFNDYYVLNDQRKIAAEALYGEVNWHQDSQAKDSAINWNSLLLIGLPIGKAGTRFNFSADELQLINAHNFPVFDGVIELTDFQAQKLFSESVDMQIDASVFPISLKLITEKMGWPVMSGTISGDLPGMVKQGSVIQFLGGLQLQVFGGDMIVDNLSIERLFGVAPVIAGDVEFSGFDLSVLTETFGFGLITGKLDGRVDELRITNWKTDRLDAQVYTVKTKGIKQVISQRAIENISSLGGIKGAISNTFLRFFDDFRYKKIKLSCKLHNSVCEIGGLKNQGNQFIIVEGGGIPKINIVGYVRSINWEEFISRLLNANFSN